MVPNHLSEADLDGMFAPYGGVPEVWAVRPVILEAVRGLDSLRPHRRLAKRLSPLLPPTSGLPDKWMVDRGVGFFWTTTNQRRAFGPRLTSEDARTRSQRRFPLVPGSGAWAGELADEIVRTLAHSDEPVRRALVHLLHVARGKTTFYERLLGAARPDVIVVASQYSLQARCVLLAARRLGIASVLVPHAPYAANRYHQDLPVNRALLRGEAEAERFRRLGAVPDRLRVIGAPGIDGRFGQRTIPSRPPVVAPSPWEAPRLEHFLQLVSSGLDGPFVVCPHPRNDLGQLRRLLPRGASISSRPTADILADGPRFVVQSSSGVALEALLLGLPVIDVAEKDAPPAYPVIERPYAASVSTADELSEAVRVVERDDLAEDRQNWARSWCEAVGTDAAVNLDRELVGIRGGGLALDAWAEGIK